MSFSTTKLTGERVLVKGTDMFGVAGQTVVDSTQWTEVNQNQAYSLAEADFDAAVNEFFAPLVAAGQALDKVVTVKTPDPTSYVVITEPVVGIAAQPGKKIKLNKDSIILRLIEQDSAGHNRLVWVGDDLEILEATPVTPVPVVGTDDAAIVAGG